MAMSDVGMRLEIATTAGATVPVAAWKQLRDCTNAPAPVQPSSRITTNYIGDSYTGEIFTKKAVAGLDFVFAYDGGTEGKQYRFLADIDDSGAQHWFRMVYPDGTKFQMLAELEVYPMPITPNGELNYGMSVVPVKANGFETLVIVTYPDEADPLGEPAGAGT